EGECPKDRLVEAIAAWAADRTRGVRLDAVLTGERVEIVDSRFAPRRHQLCPITSVVYRSLEAPLARHAISSIVRQCRPDLYLAARGRTAVDTIIQSLHDNRLIWASQNKVVAIAVPRTPGFWLDRRRPAAEPVLCDTAE